MVYEFGPYKLLAGERVLQRGGKPVPLTPKVFDILLVMVENSGRVLTKGELLQLVWPDTAVEESNMARHVSTLRKAFKPGEQYIETIPWRGYRFNAEVRFDDEPPVIDSLAVLPFLNESSAPVEEYLPDGITEALISRLSLVPGLKVMSRNSVFRYKVRESKDRFPEANIVGKQLNVRAVLTGRIRQAGGILVVSVELIDTTDNRQLWGTQYRRDLSDIFSLQESIAEEIVERLRPRLANKKPHRTKRHTENLQVYHLHLKGRFFSNKLTLEGVRKGIDLFQQAIARDPNYAPAYAGLVDCYLSLDNPAEAEKAAAKALQLDPSLAEVHASLGFLRFLHDWDWRKAEIELRRAIELNPNCAQAHQWYALYLAKMARHEEAIAEARLAHQLDPLTLSMNLINGIVLYFARQYDRAIEELQSLIELDPNVAGAHTTLGLVYTYRKMFDQAINEFQTASVLTNGSSSEQTYIKALTALCYAVSDRPEQARTLLDEIAVEQTVSPYARGSIHAQLGEHGLAMDFLERAYRERNVQVVGLKVDPALDPLRSTYRFQSLLTRAGLA